MKTWSLTLLTSSVLALAACQQPTAGGAASGAAASDAIPADLNSNTKQVSYILGQQAGELLKDQVSLVTNNGGEIDTKVLVASIQDKLEGKPNKLNESQMKLAMETFNENMTANAKKKADEAKAAGDKFLTENKSKEGVKTTASGLQYKVIKEGTGATPALGDGVLVEYTGKLIDGTEFDSTKAHGGEPFAVALTGSSVIPGWTEGLQLMKEGGEYTLYIPAKLAYGEGSPTPKIPANSALVFDMKIVKVDKGAVKDQLNKKAAKSEKK